MAVDRALSPHRAIVVRDARSDAVLAQFIGGGKPAGEVCDALERLTGSPGCLLLRDNTSHGSQGSYGATLVLTESDVIQSGTYHWKVTITRLSSQPASQPPHPPYSHTHHRQTDRSSQLAASVLAILILGSGIQLLIMLAALPFCDYRWPCAFNCYRSFISFIDGPFKVFAFIAAVQAAGRNPNRWLWFTKHLRLKHFFGFSHIRLSQLQAWGSKVASLIKQGTGQSGEENQTGKQVSTSGGIGGGGGRQDRRQSGKGGRGSRGGRGARRSSSCQGKQGGANSEVAEGSATGSVTGSGWGLDTAGPCHLRSVPLPSPSSSPPSSSPASCTLACSSSSSSSSILRGTGLGSGGGDASKHKED